MPVFQDDVDYLRALGVFQSTDYTEKGIGEVLGREEILGMPTSELPQALRRTRQPSRLNTLIRLFFLGVPAPAEAARQALAPVPLETWVQAELLATLDEGQQVAPRVQIWPVKGLTVAVDLPWMRTGPVPRDFVLPPGPTTMHLAHAMILHPSQRVLDLGTGSGTLALLAAPQAETVAATDINTRAIEFTRFNARLNRIENVRCLAGNLFEPVREERFDLVLCNPPFVISPAQRFLFRDSGQRGDVFCRQLARATVDHLATGGFYQFTANLAHQASHSWKAELEEWFAGLGCDVLVLVQGTEGASEYAMTWILSTESKDVSVVPHLYEQWMDYFEQEQIEAVSYILVTMRRSAGGPTWIQIDDPPCRVTGPCGDELAHFFTCRDMFGNANHTDVLLNQRLKLSPQTVIEQEMAMTPDGLETRRIRVQKTGGLRYPLMIHANVARLLAGCNGSRTLRQLLQEMLAQLGADWNQAVPVILPVIRTLMERSVLLADRPPFEE
jgi:SAM-dependent methyltransferase